MKKLLFGLVIAALCGLWQTASAQEDVEMNNLKNQILTEMPAEAPNFTLENTAGQMVSLSDFRGKWVVLDFWGSWCVWCIRGIPEMKAVYAELAPKVEFIGIDCNETKEAWLAAVKKYELPWVNVYCPKENPLPQIYMVPGYPTKYIISPEGTIYDMVIGEDPVFYERLRQAVNGIN